VDDTALEGGLLRDLRRIGVRDDSGCDDDDARTQETAIPQPYHPVILLARDRPDLGGRTHRDFESLGIAAEVIDKMLTGGEERRARREWHAGQR